MTKKKENLSVIIIALALSLVNVLVVCLLSLMSFSFRDYHFAFALSLSIIYSLMHIGLSLYLRFKQKGIILKGFFVYQLLGALSFFFFFAFKLGGLHIDFFEYLFNTWSFAQMPLAHVFSLKGYFPEYIVRAMIYYLYTFITGNAYLQIKKDLAFKQKIAEKRQMEEESFNRHG